MKNGGERLSKVGQVRLYGRFVNRPIVGNGL